MKDNVKHVWFDFAGTLFKETPEFNELHDKLRYQTYANLQGLDDLSKAKNEFLELYSKYGSNSAVFRSLGQSSGYWMKALDDFDFASVLKPDPIVYETLNKLKDIVLISLFTNFVRDRIPKLLALLDIPVEDFTHILGGDDIKERKPALDGFRLMIEKSNLPADQILYVGDRVDVDIKPAKAVGMKSCLVYSKSPEADYSFDSFDELMSLVQ